MPYRPKRVRFWTPVVVAWCIAVLAISARANAADITICWEQSRFAGGLVDLSRLFESETGHRVRFNFQPPAAYEASAQERLQQGGEGCDLMFGRAAWLGLAVRRGAYMPLDDLIADGIVDLDEFLPAAAFAHALWPKNGASYWAVPAVGDAVGWTYRKDWFARPELRSAFRAEFQRDLRLPGNWSELIEIARFFHEREIDGTTVNGLVLPLAPERQGGIAPAALSALYAWGFAHEYPAGSYIADGAVNAAPAVAALEALRGLIECCTRPGATRDTQRDVSRAFRNGEAALQLNWFGQFAVSLNGARERQFTGYLANPGQEAHGSVLGGWHLAATRAASNPEVALAYLAWFSLPEVQQIWSELGGMPLHKAAFETPIDAAHAAFTAAFLQAAATGRVGWQEPEHERLRSDFDQWIGGYLVDGVDSAQTALDRLVADWTKIFERLGLCSRIARQACAASGRH